MVLLMVTLVQKKTQDGRHIDNIHLSIYILSIYSNGASDGNSSSEENARWQTCSLYQSIYVYLTIYSSEWC